MGTGVNKKGLSKPAVLRELRALITFASDRALALAVARTVGVRGLCCHAALSRRSCRRCMIQIHFQLF